MKNAIYNKAFAYLADGKSVIPVGKDKRPLLSSWKEFQSRYATEDEVKSWFKKWPQANIAIVTGKISGITVVDIDTGHDTSTALSAFPETYTVKTPTGGFHLFYLFNSSVQQTANTFPQFPHVDIRNTGGFIVAAPSECEYEKGKQYIKGSYSILKAIALAPFPMQLFSPEAKKPEHPSVNQVLRGFDKMADGDGRNVALTKIAGKILRLVSPGDHESVAFPMLLAANARFKKPLPEREVHVIFESIGAKERDKPLAEVEFITTDKGSIIANVENVRRTLQSDPELIGHFRYNTFAGVIETNFEGAREGVGQDARRSWEPFQRADVSRVRSYLMSTYAHFTKIGHTEVEDAMLQVSEKNKVSPPAQWIRSLVWDGKPRLDTWLPSVYGTPNDVYHRAVGSNWLKGLVQRLTHPGCKFDYVLVLEGKQGIRKSTSLAVLGGKWHMETVFTPDNKDFFMLFAGNAIVEFSEGETLSRTEAKKLKAVITMQHDKFRPPYERSAKDFPRQCVFAMTTNQEQYLKDETGNRRWLPVAVKKQADIEWLSENREQLYAEAYHRVVTLKETTYEFPEAETAYQQNLRQLEDPRVSIIFDWYYNVLTDFERTQGITTRQVFIHALTGGFGDGRTLDRAEEMIIGSILRDALRLDKQRSMIKGTRVYQFFPTPESEAQKPDADQAKGTVQKSIETF